LIINSPAHALPNFWDKTESDKLADSIVESMSDEELLGQVFFLGYLGKTPSSIIKNWITDRGVGGVKIFSRNVKSLPMLAASISEMQELASRTRFGIPLFVATDQEGGWVRHIKFQTSITPGNLALGAERLPEDSYLTGYYIGMELRKLGINMNFAPTIDVYTNPKASVIGPRSFSSDPVEAAVLAVPYFKGMQKAGIISTAKHFPGHGNADKDSHGFLPIIHTSLKTLDARELVPYRFLIKEGLSAIMSGHLAFPDILGNNTPASLSSFFITKILRKKLGFTGIVITDDMEMGGVIRAGETTPTACRKAILAGNDMILISHSPAAQENTHTYLLRILKQDVNFRAAVKKAVKKILIVKMHYFKGDNAVTLKPELKSVKGFSTGQADKFFFNAACRSVTLIKGARIPFIPAKGEKILLVGQYEDFLKEGLMRFKNADTYYFRFSPFYHADPDEISRIAGKAANYSTIIFCLANFNSLDVLKALKKYKKNIIVISALTPVYLREVPWVKTAIAVYGRGRNSFRAGFAALSGDFTPGGKLPINFLDVSKQK